MTDFYVELAPYEGRDTFTLRRSEWRRALELAQDGFHTHTNTEFDEESARRLGDALSQALYGLEEHDLRESYGLRDLEAFLAGEGASGFDIRLSRWGAEDDVVDLDELFRQC